jgi:type IV pilus assembly protein PilE
MLWHDSINQKRVLKMDMKKGIQKGFTLVELMLVVVIIGILAKIAFPNYQNYVKKSRIAEATSALSDYRVKYENFFLDNRVYPSNAGATTTACLPTTNTVPTAFVITCSSDPTQYTITATGGGQMANFAYTINQANTKATLAGTPWGSSATCWVKGSGGQC